MGKTFGSPHPPKTDPNAMGRRLRRRVENGDLLVGGMIFECLQPFIVKIYKHAGFDFVYLDNEHVLMAGLPSAAAFIQAARDNDLPVIAKCPVRGRAEVARLLEAGVTGIQLPRTESRADIEELFDYMKFTPEGTRAAAPILGNVDYVMPVDVAQWMRDANEATLIVGHIETRRGFENFEQIVTTPGLDIIYAGPLDFSISMGHPGDFDHPEVAAAMEQMLTLCREHGVLFGTSASGMDKAGDLIRKGYRFFEAGDEMSMLHQGASRVVDGYRALLDES